MLTHGKIDLLTMGQKYNVKSACTTWDKNRFVSRLVWFFWVTGLTLLFSMGPIQWVLANGSICNGYIYIAEQHPSKVNPVYRLKLGFHRIRVMAQNMFYVYHGRFQDFRLGRAAYCEGAG